MNLKKTFTGCLILAAILMLAVVSAGCVNQPSGDGQGTDVPEAAVFISVEKTGTDYSVGDTLEVILASSNPSDLYVKECDDGFSIDKKEISVKHGDKEVACVKFTVKALKEGDHTFSIAMKKSSDDGLDDIVYGGTLHVINTGAEPLTPRGVFTEIVVHPPSPGDYYDISVRGNATTGYHWAAAENKGLIVSEPVYIPDEAEGKVGAGGTYHWYVTAEAPGEYEFTAYEFPPAGGEPTGRIVEPVAFVKKTE